MLEEMYISRNTSCYRGLSVAIRTTTQNLRIKILYIYLREKKRIFLYIHAIHPRSRERERKTEKQRKRKRLFSVAFLHLDINKEGDYSIFLSKCNKDVSMRISMILINVRNDLDIQDVP